MSYIGKEPADSFISFAKQDFSTSATTSYTLDNAVTNENELALFINFVRQEPTTAYTASGTTLTLSSATASTDDMYCVYLGQAKQTVNAPDGSVGTTQLAADAVTEAKIADSAVENEHLNANVITGQTAETSIATDDTILIHDTSASALRKMTRANFVSGVGGVSTPYFLAKIGSSQAVSDNIVTKVSMDTEVIDSDNEYDHSANFRFTPQTAGKYFVAAAVAGTTFGVDAVNSMEVYIYKNGSAYLKAVHNAAQSYQYWLQPTVNAIVDMNGSSDYLEVYAKLDNVANSPQYYGSSHSWFMAHKLIG